MGETARLEVKQGVGIPVTAVLGNRAEDKVIRYNVWTGSTLLTGSSITLTHISGGRYIDASFAMPAFDVCVILEIFEADGVTPNLNGEQQVEINVQLDEPATFIIPTTPADAVTIVDEDEPEDIVDARAEDPDSIVVMDEPEQVIVEAGPEDEAVSVLAESDQEVIVLVEDGD